MDKTGLDTTRDVKLDYDFGKQVCVALHPLCSHQDTPRRDTLQRRGSGSVRMETTTTAPHPTRKRSTAPSEAFREGGLAEVCPAVGGQVQGLTRWGKRGRTSSLL